MIHKSEFSNYEQARKQYSVGNKISFYIKDITFKGSSPRIMLTLDKSKINEEKSIWFSLKSNSEGKTFDFTLTDSSLNIEVNSFPLSIHISAEDINKAKKYSKIQITNIDIISKEISFDFV
jgi:hypothetical protein